MDFEAVVKNRHSIRAFLQKEIEEEKLKKILELTNLAPSAGNLQAYEIFVVKKNWLLQPILKIL
ncbi:MAG: nitroreductase family protein [Candidatus Aenigmatarchaeota archaeon]